MKETLLKLKNEAAEWENGSPIGGGSFGALLFGGTETEKIYLNEETVWSSMEMAPPDPAFAEKRETLKQMYLSGDHYLDDAAEELLGDSMQRVCSYESAGMLEIKLPDLGELKKYKRELDLEHGILEVKYLRGDTLVRETAFCSYAYEVTAVRYRFGKKCSLNAAFKRELTEARNVEDGMLLCDCKTQFGEHRFAVGIKPVTDGQITFRDGAIQIEDAEDAIFYIAIATEYNYGDDYMRMAAEILTEAEDHAALLENHKADFAAIFNRTSLTLNGDEKLTHLPADERLRQLQQDPAAEDPGLYELYFNFGKYLLISSSREGTLPANLQGVWAEKLENPWNADYHTNINLQMNYWPAEVLDLGDCHTALFDYMNNILLESGKKTAKELYGCRGTVVHHLSDLYGYTAPADGLWGLWPLGGAWLSTHMWEHYLFTGDTDFLREIAYEYMKQCALFFIDAMFPDETGTLLSGPSTSPENHFWIDTPDGRKEGYLCCSPTMDVEIITETLRNYIAAENLLQIDEETRLAAEAALSKMPKLKVGKNGTLNEWPEEYEEAEPGHRHISHAFGLYPGSIITEETPEYYEAIRKTLERRLSHGGGHTGWSRAWLVNLYARLHDGAQTFRHLRLLLTRSTNPNLFDNHPPFQIDGNFGGTAGIAEALLQSHDGKITLCPAVPETVSGSFAGFKARGNITVGALFRDGRVTGFMLASPLARSVKIAVPGAQKITSGNRSWLPEDGVFTLPVGTDPTGFSVCLSNGETAI